MIYLLCKVSHKYFQISGTFNVSVNSGQVNLSRPKFKFGSDCPDVPHKILASIRKVVRDHAKVFLNDKKFTIIEDTDSGLITEWKFC